MTTKIEWTEATWNPSTGCDRVSPGCDNCYALTLAGRLKAMGSAKYQNDGDPKTSGPGFGITEHKDTLDAPLSWRKPRRVFVNSMSDLFHPGISDEFIARVFAVMAATPQHTYQCLTKRHGRMRFLMNSGEFFSFVLDEAVEALGLDGIPWPLDNVWLGVTAEDQKRADLRVRALMETPAAVRFLSCEPLLGPIRLHRGHCFCPTHETHDRSNNACFNPVCPDLRRPDWVIVGGESGPDARPMPQDWARTIRDDATGANVAFFFKQWGGRTPKAGGRELDGRTWDEYPEAS